MQPSCLKLSVPAPSLPVPIQGQQTVTEMWPSKQSHFAFHYFMEIHYPLLYKTVVYIFTIIEIFALFHCVGKHNAALPDQH
jgi:hypothetical protein